MRRTHVHKLLSCFAVVTLLAGCGAQFSPSHFALGHQDEGTYTLFNGVKGPFKIFARDKGKGTPILFIHGFAANTYTWRHMVSDFSRDHRAIAVDLKGFGESDKPADGKYSIFDQADLISQFIKKKNLKNLTVVGHSLGGAIALATAIQLKKSHKKSPIKRLVLIDSLAYPQTLPFYMKALRTPGLSQIGVTVIPAEMQARTALKFAYLEDERISEQSVKEYARPLRSAAGRQALIETARQIISPGIVEAIDQFKNLDIPTKLIWCRHDRIVPLINGFRLENDLPDASMQIIEDCGHNPHEEKPAETIMAMRMFLSE